MAKSAAALICGVLIGLGIGKSVAEEFGANVVENRKRIALAMVDHLAGPGGAAHARVAEFGDLNLDGYWELVVRHEECPTCPPAIFSLTGQDYVDIFAAAGAEASGVVLDILDETTRGYRDIRVRGRVFAWNGRSYVDVTGRGSQLDAAGYVDACVAAGEYSYYAEAADDKDAATRTMCGCVADRIGVLGFAQRDLDAFRQTVELRAQSADWDHIDLGELGDEIPLVESGCAVGNGFARSLPVGPQRYASWTTNYGNLVMNPDFEGDAAKPENALDYRGFIAACASNDDVLSSNRISTQGRAVSVCGCTAEVASMAGATQSHVDALTSLFDFSLSEDEVNETSPGLADFADEASNWCTNRLSALIDGTWPEAPD